MVSQQRTGDSGAGLTDRIHTNRGRAESFGASAADYDRFRPDYPEALIDDLVALRPRSVLDVGSGTGKAARQLAARGLSVLGVEIDPRMAAVARGHGLAVEVGSFEDWDDAGRRFDLITCAQAWHWVDPLRGPAKAARLVNPGGSLAVFWNYSRHDASIEALDPAYAAHAPELMRTSVARGVGAGSVGSYAEPLETAGFTVQRREYHWQRRYGADEWIALLGTHSDHALLDPDRRTALFAAVRDAIAALGGTLSISYDTQLLLASAPGTVAAMALLSVPEVAQHLGVPVTRVHQYLREGQLIAVREDGVRGVPADFLQDGEIVKSLRAVITLLRDARFSDEQIVEWLRESDDTLPGTPIGALRANRGTEVKRRAQAAGI